MTGSVGPEAPHQWQTREYVDLWFADKPRQQGYLPVREKLVSLLPFPPGAAIRVLDIGTGDGALSRQVLAAYPGAHLVGHDFSPTMLDRARQQLVPFSERVTFVQSDLRDPAWTRVIEGTFDAVVSSIAIHNVAEHTQLGASERIRDIYGEVCGLVRRGGCFLNYDHLTPPGPMAEQVYLQDEFTAYHAGLTAEAAAGKSPEALQQAFRERRRAPTGVFNRALPDQLHWLQQAGFDEVDCLWKDTRSAILGGFRHAR